MQSRSFMKTIAFFFQKLFGNIDRVSYTFKYCILGLYGKFTKTKHESFWAVFCFSSSFILRCFDIVN